MPSRSEDLYFYVAANLDWPVSICSVETCIAGRHLNPSLAGSAIGVRPAASTDLDCWLEEWSPAYARAGVSGTAGTAVNPVRG
jgi:hypothetical protein